MTTDLRQLLHSSAYLQSPHGDIVFDTMPDLEGDGAPDNPVFVTPQGRVLATDNNFALGITPQTYAHMASIIRRQPTQVSAHLATALPFLLKRLEEYNLTWGDYEHDPLYLLDQCTTSDTVIAAALLADYRSPEVYRLALQGQWAQDNKVLLAFWSTRHSSDTCAHLSQDQFLALASAIPPQALPDFLTQVLAVTPYTGDVRDIIALWDLVVANIPQTHWVPGLDWTKFLDVTKQRPVGQVKQMCVPITDTRLRAQLLASAPSVSHLANLRAPLAPILKLIALLKTKRLPKPQVI